MAALFSIIYALSLVAWWLAVITSCIICLFVIAFFVILVYVRAKDRFVSRIEMQIMRDIGDDIKRCSNWTKENEDAQLLLCAVSNLLIFNNPIDGAHLKSEIARLKELSACNAK